MEDDKRKLKTKRRFPRKGLTAAAVLLVIAFFVCLSVQYLSFVSKTVYEESTAHLDEILHKSNSMLSEMVRKNRTPRSTTAGSAANSRMMGSANSRQTPVSNSA